MRAIPSREGWKSLLTMARLRVVPCRLPAFPLTKFCLGVGNGILPTNSPQTRKQRRVTACAQKDIASELTNCSHGEIRKRDDGAIRGELHA